MRARLLLAGLLLFVAATGARAQERDGFPHAEHQGLFPVCTGCHQPASPDPAGLYPEPTSCNGCHDGVEERRVNWTAPAPAATGMLAFDHAEHAREAAADDVSCEGCHVGPGAERMSIERAVVGDCLSCHAHEATEHLVTAECSTCHRPLAASGIGADRIAMLPAPPDHAQPGFESVHAGGAECQVCHTRERCTTCHVNAASVGEIQAIPAAPPSMDLPRWAAHYPTPADHLGDGWLAGHGSGTDATSCTTCHTQNDCAACHVETPPAPVPAFPRRSDVEAPGAGLQRSRPVSHDRTSFEMAHGAEASTAMASCTACHGRTECNACHDAPAQPGFHEANYSEGHSTDAWARRLECSNCHDVEVFCGACHRQAGIAAAGNPGAVYHDAEGAWLLRHSQAARQGLETCVSCHEQQTCLRCHSQLGSFQVSPHGPDFDPERARARNSFVCRTCHLSDPGGGGP